MSGQQALFLDVCVVAALAGAAACLAALAVRATRREREHRRRVQNRAERLADLTRPTPAEILRGETDQHQREEGQP